MFSMFLLRKRSTCGSLCKFEKGVTCTAEVLDLVCMYNYIQTGLIAQGRGILLFRLSENVYVVRWASEIFLSSLVSYTQCNFQSKTLQDKQNNE